MLSAKTHFKDTQKKHFQDGEINASQKQPFYESNQNTIKNCENQLFRALEINQRLTTTQGVFILVKTVTLWCFSILYSQPFLSRSSVALKTKALIIMVAMTPAAPKPLEENRCRAAKKPYPQRTFTVCSVSQYHGNPSSQSFSLFGLNLSLLLTDRLRPQGICQKQSAAII